MATSRGDAESPLEVLVRSSTACATRSPWVSWRKWPASSNASQVECATSSCQRRPQVPVKTSSVVPTRSGSAVGRLFDGSGFSGITMAGAATEAGVSRQLVYDHFGDLDQLCEAFVKGRLDHYRQDPTMCHDVMARPEISHLQPDDAAATQ